MKPIQIGASITAQNEDSIMRYFRELRNLKPLKPEEELELAKRIKVGDKRALEILVTSNLRFVISIAKKHVREGRSLLDLISDGNLGLIEAAQRFDETRGFKFVTFAVWWIRRAMLSGNRNQEQMVHLPTNIAQGISVINKSRMKLLQVLERESTAAELAIDTGLAFEKVKDITAFSLHTQSLDKAVNEEGSHTLLDIIVDTDQSNKPDKMVDDSLLIEIRRSFTILDAREQFILNSLFGLDTGVTLEIKDLAEQLGMCKERVRQIKHGALKKLVDSPHAKRLWDYI